jgi:hypothetical protein
MTEVAGSAFSEFRQMISDLHYKQASDGCYAV